MRLKIELPEDINLEELKNAAVKDKDREAQFLLAAHYLGINQLELAEKLFKESGQQDHPIAFEQLGEMCESKGDLVGAREYYEKSKKIILEEAKLKGSDTKPRYIGLLEDA